MQRELLLYPGSEFFSLFRPRSPHHYPKLSLDVLSPSSERKKPTFPWEDLDFFYYFLYFCMCVFVACVCVCAFVACVCACNDVIVS